jgi:hypothetical protein
MAIKISDSELNRENIHEGIHRIKLSFKGKSSSNGEEVKLLLRSKYIELVKFLVDGKEKDEIRFSRKFSNNIQEFEHEIVVKQLFSPESQQYAGFLISARNEKGDTASEEFVLLCN